MESVASIVAPVATTIAAFVVAANFGARITGYGFIIFTVGSVAWALLGYVTDQPNLLWQNVLLTGLNIFGIWRWLGRQSRLEHGAMAAAQASEARLDEALFPISLLTRAGIRDGRGNEVGTCVDAMAGCRSGRVRYVVAAEGGLGGVGETLRRVDWRLAAVDGETLKIADGSSEFDRLPVVEKDNWPER